MSKKRPPPKFAARTVPVHPRSETERARWAAAAAAHGMSLSGFAAMLLTARAEEWEALKAAEQDSAAPSAEDPLTVGA